MIAARISFSSAATTPGPLTIAGPRSSRSTTTAKRNGTGAATVQVSFNRPYGKYCQIFDAPLSTGSGEFLLWEFPLAFWMESLGYDVTYISNLDTHRDASGLLRAKGFLSVGHDEYWSIEMFENVRAAVKRGVNAAFLSGNAICGRILFDERVRAFERVGVFGPPGGTQEFQSMKSLKHERPYANELMGAHSTGPGHGRRRLDLCEAGALALRRQRDESRRRHSRPRRLGMAWRPGADRRPRNRGHRPDAKRAR
jgi:hypothetical protein